MPGVTEQRITHTVMIYASHAQCYDALIHFETYPKFIPQIRAVAAKGNEGVLEWRIQGPDNEDIHWDMKIDALRHQNNVISWHTIRDADIAHSGAITLKPISENQTQLDFVVEFQPNKKQFQNEQFVQQAKQAVVQAIERLKPYLERGRGSSQGRQAATSNTNKIDESYSI